ncbi:MAG: BatA and WFA domain-containing protein [Gemmatimonadota bacterium]|nr:BatA and WFA domain-containing protein [Gemmatimonadota bacterium]
MFGLSFSSPAVLHGLWAALLPLAIHLLNRRRAVTVAFSNVALLQALQQDRMRRFRLKQVLALILRTLVIVFLVLGFARPRIKGAAGDGAVRTSASLLLDRSLSMSWRVHEGTLFDRARNRTKEILKLFNAQDDVRLFQVDDRVEEIEPGRPDRLAARLEVLRYTHRGTDFRPALTAALARATQTEMPNRELYVVSDFAANGWTEIPDSLFSGKDISVFCVPVRSSEPDNMGIRRAAPVEGILGAGSASTLRVSLTDYGGPVRMRAPVQVYLDGRRVGQQVIRTEPGTSRRLHFRFVPERGGQIPLRVELDDDDMAADNVYTSVLNVPERVSALLIAENDDETYFVARALEAGSRHAVSVRSVRPDDLNADLLHGTDAALMFNVSRLSAGAMKLLEYRVRSGMGLMVVLGDRVDFRHYNTALLPLLFPASLIGVAGSPGQNVTYHRLRETLPDHAVFSDFGSGDGLQMPRFYGYFRMRLGGSSQPVLLFRSGDPALAETSLGAGRVVVFAAGLDSDLSWTDLPLTGIFVPFIHRLSRYLAAGSPGRSDYVVGDRVYRNRSEIQAREALLRPPAGEARTIWPEQRGAHSVWPVGEVDLPGIWEIYARDRLADRFAVRIDAGEGNPASAPAALLERVFEGARLRFVEPESSVAGTVREVRGGRELWRIALGLALVSMIGEVIVAKSERQARRVQSGSRRPGGDAP